ncbi:hypothetical protein [Nostoc sp. UHCC 0252]|nr:hypothetical protein [Nostoc sp. UHCC 0252]MEA5606482.1 hypothetical protein [Nostoc sp. UHCC 0252]
MIRILEIEGQEPLQGEKFSQMQYWQQYLCLCLFAEPILWQPPEQLL